MFCTWVSFVLVCSGFFNSLGGSTDNRMHNILLLSYPFQNRKSNKLFVIHSFVQSFFYFFSESILRHIKCSLMKFIRIYFIKRVWWTFMKLHKISNNVSPATYVATLLWMIQFYLLPLGYLLESLSTLYDQFNISSPFCFWIRWIKVVKVYGRIINYK